MRLVPHNSLYYNIRLVNQRGENLAISLTTSLSYEGGRLHATPLLNLRYQPIPPFRHGVGVPEALIANSAGDTTHDCITLSLSLSPS